MSDLIDRQEAIDALDCINGTEEVLRSLPSAQPNLQPTCNNLATDCVSRQDAIDAILAVTGNSSVRELYEHVQEHGLSDMWSGGVSAAIDVIIAVPSAQPEEDCDTCKHGRFGSVECNVCRVGFPSKYERRTDENR